MSTTDSDSTSGGMPIDEAMRLLRDEYRERRRIQKGSPVRHAANHPANDVNRDEPSDQHMLYLHFVSGPLWMPPL